MAGILIGNRYLPQKGKVTKDGRVIPVHRDLKKSIELRDFRKRQEAEKKRKEELLKEELTLCYIDQGV